MESDGNPFDEALREAQELGFAEADPGLDIDGFDTAHKAAILASLAYGFPFPLEAVHVEGIRGISDVDMRHAADLGYRIKLLAVIKEDNGEVEVRVHPTLVPVDHMLASVKGVFNAVMVHGDLVGQTLYYGRGAGQDPTASTVIGDIVDVVRNLVTGAVGRVPGLSRGTSEFRLRKPEDIVTRYYLRMDLRDDPGVLAAITRALGDDGISIASVMQKEVTRAGYAEVVIVTHEASERAMASALGKIENMDVVGDQTVRLRIED
jgi:homoserine dehydrogenase